MAENRSVYSEPVMASSPNEMVPVLLGASARQEKFIVSSYTLNKIEDESGQKYDFPGNIAPEGYFYSPFYEVTLKELDDEPQSISVKRINFKTSGASIRTSSVTYYNPEMGTFGNKTLNVITINSPIAYDFIIGQPFSIYDVNKDVTYRGYLDAFNTNSDGTCRLTITTETSLSRSTLDGVDGKSGYIISLMEENAPTYAEFIPATQKLIWRAPKKMSDLASDSPIYNMPFTNGRLYIHKNIDVFVRRQDPHGDYKLYRPSDSNPLRRFQIEGNAKLDFDYIQTIIDSMVDAC